MAASASATSLGVVRNLTVHDVSKTGSIQSTLATLATVNDTQESDSNADSRRSRKSAYLLLQALARVRHQIQQHDPAARRLQNGLYDLLNHHLTDVTGKEPASGWLLKALVRIDRGQATEEQCAVWVTSAVRAATALLEETEDGKLPAGVQIYSTALRIRQIIMSAVTELSLINGVRN